jgi:hypothetical protein
MVVGLVFLLPFYLDEGVIDLLLSGLGEEDATMIVLCHALVTEATIVIDYDVSFDLGNGRFFLALLSFGSQKRPHARPKQITLMELKASTILSKRQGWQPRHWIGRKEIVHVAGQEEGEGTGASGDHLMKIIITSSPISAVPNPHQESATPSIHK